MGRQRKRTISYVLVAISCLIAFLPCTGRQTVYAKQQTKSISAQAVEKLAVSRSEELAYDVSAKVMPYYIEAYYLDKRIRIEERAFDYLARVRGEAYETFVVTGQGKQQYDSIEDAYRRMKRALSEDLKQQKKAFDYLKEYTDLDMSTYRLESPHVAATPDRKILDELIKYSSIMQMEQENTKEQMEAVFETYLSAEKELEDCKDSLLSAEKMQIIEQKKRVTGQTSEEAYAQVCISVYDSSIAVISKRMEVTNALWTLNNMSMGALFDGQATTEGSLVTEKGTYYIADSADGVLKDFRIWVKSEDTGIDAYELWIDGKKAGTALSGEQSISVLSNTVQNAKKAFVRLYHGDNFLCDCAIDLSRESGEMTLRYPKKSTRSLE